MSAGRRGIPWWAIAAALGGVAPATAQATCHLRGGEAEIRLVGPQRHVVNGPLPAPLTTRAGDYEVHFGTDALGKPDSLRITTGDGSVVTAAAAPAAAAARETLAPDDARWRAMGGGKSWADMPPPEPPGASNWGLRWLDAETGNDCRIVARGAATGAADLGVLARWSRDEHGRRFYRWIWDRPRAELRLERVLGDTVLVLAKAPSPAADERVHELALQVQGFRLQGFCDQALAVQVLDGALAGGKIGTWWSGAGEVRWDSVALEPVAKGRPSSALVAQGTAATLVARTVAAAGHFAVVELALDRPHALVPVTANGAEPCLLQRPAAPQVLLADWLGTLGRGTVAEVGIDGGACAFLAWPAAAAVRHQAALVRMLVVSPDGEIVVVRTPPVALWF